MKSNNEIKEEKMILFPFPLIYILPNQAPFIEKRIIQKNEQSFKEISKQNE